MTTITVPWCPKCEKGTRLAFPGELCSCGERLVAEEFVPLSELREERRWPMEVHQRGPQEHRFVTEWERVEE